MSWLLKEQLQQTLAQEKGAMVFPPGSRSPMALIYPNTYHVGMSNLGLQIIYQQVNQRQDTACERFFWPQARTRAEHIRTNTPLLSLETQRPLADFPLLAFAVSFEMDYFHILDILSLGHIPLLASERQERDPLIIIGGPCATFNPEPLADFVDLCIIGEGEEIIHEFLQTYYECQKQGLARQELLLTLSKLSGIYVPSLYQHFYAADGTLTAIQPLQGAPAKVKRRYIHNLEQYPAHTVITTDQTEFKDLFLIEVARGCGRHCRFCMAGYCFRRPRNRSLTQIAAAADLAGQTRTKVGLMGAAISDYPQIDELCKLVSEHHLGMSVASLRADTLTPALTCALAASGHRTLTLAPEAGSARLRRIINKTISEEDLLHAVSMAAAAGIPHIRLYIMIGLPGETAADVSAITDLALLIKKHMLATGSKGKLTLSINPFVPKPFTPFQWLPMAEQDLVNQRLKQIQQALKKEKNIELISESPREAYIQAVLARGDRRLGPVLLATITDTDGSNNVGVKNWKKAVRKYNLSEDFYLYRQRQENELFPWETIDTGVKRSYLTAEYHRSCQELGTSPCVDNCSRCGVCLPTK